jgi:hypothetical protein
MHLAPDFAGNNPEPAVALSLKLRHRDRIDPRQRRRLRPEPNQERLNTRYRALNLNRHAIRIVPDEPRQPLFLCQPKNKWPEPHPLHNPAHRRPAPHPFASVSRVLFWSFVYQLVSHRKQA